MSLKVVPRAQGSFIILFTYELESCLSGAGKLSKLPARFLEKDSVATNRGLGRIENKLEASARENEERADLLGRLSRGQVRL